MKKNNYLNPQEFESVNLSRRNFSLSIAALVSITALGFLGTLHAVQTKKYTHIIRAANAMVIDTSSGRVGAWIRKNIVPRKEAQIINEADMRLKSIPILSKNKIREMISEDYLQGRTVVISNIRFSTLETALCLVSNPILGKTGFNNGV